MFDALVAMVRNLYPNETPVPLHAPRFLGNEKKYLSECVDSTYVSYLGPFVKQFEQAVKGVTSSRFAVAVNSGTSALHLALLGIGVRPGDEVLLPSLTFVATANAVSYTGANCIFIDCEPETLGICPQQISRFLEEKAVLSDSGECINRETGRKIAGVIAVNVFGQPAKLDEISEICLRYRIAMIEDATESLGTSFKGLSTGKWGKVGVLSFNGNKIVTSGGGGMVITDDQIIAERVTHLSTTAKKPHEFAYYHDEIGFNYRMPNVNAAIGCAQMEKFDEIIKNKRETAERYQDFCRLHGIRFILEPEGARSNYWLNAVWLEDSKAQMKLLEMGARIGVQFRPPWQPLHTLPMYEHCGRTEMTTTVDACAKVVCLPSSFRLEDL